jgi:hypothetical protein
MVNQRIKKYRQAASRLKYADGVDQIPCEFKKTRVVPEESIKLEGNFSA